MAGTLYVVLRHEGIERPHFDLMFQTTPGSALATWRSQTWPIESPVAVEKLADHRQAYLAFEGDIAGNRGSVRRVEQGLCAARKSVSGWTIHLQSLPDGKRFFLQFDERPDGTWLCGPTPDAPVP